MSDSEENRVADGIERRPSNPGSEPEIIEHEPADWNSWRTSSSKGQLLKNFIDKGVSMDQARELVAKEFKKRRGKPRKKPAAHSPGRERGRKPGRRSSSRWFSPSRSGDDSEEISPRTKPKSRQERSPSLIGERKPSREGRSSRRRRSLSSNGDDSEAVSPHSKPRARKERSPSLLGERIRRPYSGLPDGPRSPSLVGTDSDENTARKRKKSRKYKKKDKRAASPNEAHRKSVASTSKEELTDEMINRIAMQAIGDNDPDFIAKKGTENWTREEWRDALKKLRYRDWKPREIAVFLDGIFHSDGTRRSQLPEKYEFPQSDSKLNPIRDPTMLAEIKQDLRDANPNLDEEDIEIRAEMRYYARQLMTANPTMSQDEVSRKLQEYYDNVINRRTRAERRYKARLDANLQSLYRTVDEAVKRQEASADSRRPRSPPPPIRERSGVFDRPRTSGRQSSAFPNRPSSSASNHPRRTSSQSLESELLQRVLRVEEISKRDGFGWSPEKILEVALNSLPGDKDAGIIRDRDRSRRIYREISRPIPHHLKYLPPNEQARWARYREEVALTFPEYNEEKKDNLAEYMLERFPGER